MKVEVEEVEERREKGTYSAGKLRLVVDVCLTPCHQVLDVLRGWHLGRSLEVLGVLP